MKKQPLSLYLRIGFCLLCLTGIIITVAKNPDPLSSVSYYTIQSNILCLIVMGIIVYRQWQGKTLTNRALIIIKGGTTMAILLTFLIFNIVLLPVILKQGMTRYATGLGNILVHYFTPLYLLADYLIFDLKGLFKLTDPLWWVVFPLFYFIYANVYAAFGGTYFDGEFYSRFPYFFINPDIIGVGGVAIAVSVIIIFYIGLSYAFFGIDKLLARSQLKGQEQTK
ncbi:MAG: Pr6Pr family membrane protein [Candidatus Izemoplasmatales bacterium]|nr:Pr6Pr family membrane protein [Candidatus Izemoplasmatales bacterium]MDD3865080.1 Pr6Pr family membrane protein [Candidatus Izemoplasmatales bacterium]